MGIYETHASEPKARRVTLKGRSWVFKGIVLACCLLVVVGVTGGVLWWRNRERPQQRPEVSEERQLYGSIANTNKDVNFSSSIEVSQKIDYYVSEAWTLRTAGKPDDALKMLREGEKLANGGSYPQLYAAFGEFYAAQRNKTEAKAYYEKALAAIDASTLSDKEEYKKLYEEQMKSL